MSTGRTLLGAKEQFLFQSRATVYVKEMEPACFLYFIRLQVRHMRAVVIAIRPLRSTHEILNPIGHCDSTNDPSHALPCNLPRLSLYRMTPTEIKTTQAPAMPDRGRFQRENVPKSAHFYTIRRIVTLCGAPCLES